MECCQLVRSVLLMLWSLWYVQCVYHLMCYWSATALSVLSLHAATQQVHMPVRTTTKDTCIRSVMLCCYPAVQFTAVLKLNVLRKSLQCCLC
jgi:hypothetical protein